VQDITSAASIPKGSFYSYFDSKETFALEILQAYWTEITGLEAKAPKRASLTPLGRHFRALADFHEQNGFQYGCLIGNLALELGGTHDNVRGLLIELFNLWGDTVKSKLALLLPAHSPTELARLSAALIAAFEGAVMQAKVLRNNEPFRNFEALVLARLVT
jgi:TetR/AcrR family transcriptional repressor of nem operon